MSKASKAPASSPVSAAPAASPTAEKKWARPTATDGPAIGIDLGTTYSCVGVWRGGTVEIIANEMGNRTTPSFVSFTDTERMLGDAAHAAQDKNMANTIYDTKRLLGRAFADPVVQEDMKLWPFKVVDGGAGKPAVQVTVKNETKSFSPEELSGMVLTKMRTVAEQYVGAQINQAVITVPAYFNDAQRQATKDSAAIAGLTVLRIINEPTAAAIAYGMDKSLALEGKSSGISTGSASRASAAGEQNVLVFDLGGGTFDVSLLSIRGGIFEVKATAGNAHLGGQDFDARLVKFLVSDFAKKTGVDITGNVRANGRLRTAAERVKRTLSAAPKASIELDSLADDQDYYTTITRAKFESLCADLFRQVLEPVAKVLLDAKVEKKQVDEIVLVGGSTRIPKVQEIIKAYFNGKELCTSINPDEAVAYGAAVQAAVLAGEKDKSIDDLLLLDVTALTLGVELAGGVMHPLIKRNSTIPRRVQQTFSTFADNQTSVFVQVYEGERARTADNALLSRFELKGIPAAPRATPQIVVTFDIDADGILNVSAEDKKSGRATKITISNDKGRLSKEQIDKAIADAARNAEADAKTRAQVAARTKLETYAVTARAALDQKVQLPAAEAKTVSKLVGDTLTWLAANPSAAAIDYANRLTALQTACNAAQVDEGKDEEDGDDVDDTPAPAADDVSSLAPPLDDDAPTEVSGGDLD